MSRENICRGLPRSTFELPPPVAQQVGQNAQLSGDLRNGLSPAAASRTASNLNSGVNFRFGSAMNTSMPEHNIGHNLGVHQIGSGSNIFYQAMAR